MLRITRRRLLVGAAGFAWAAALPTLPARAEAAPEASRDVAPFWVSARQDAQGQHRVTAFDDAEQLRWDVPVPQRGHAFALHPHAPELVAFARRPGTFALVLDAREGTVRHRLTPLPGQQFQGHGVFSADGRLLYVAEQSQQTSQGTVGVYDREAGYRRVGGFPTGGMDLHELVLLPDGQHLAAAHGGMRFSPDAPGQPLNVASMDPLLSYHALPAGEVLRTVRPPADLHQLSIHHLAVARDGTVAVAMQHEGPALRLVPLVALWHPRDAALRMLPTPKRALRSMKGYCGSVAVDVGGGLLAVSCPRGNRALLWNLADERLLGHVALPDGCGLAATPRAGEFLLTSGTGGAARFGDAGSAAAVDDPPLTQQALHTALLENSRWDNHMAVHLPAHPSIS